MQILPSLDPPEEGSVTVSPGTSPRVAPRGHLAVDQVLKSKAFCY